MNSFVTEVLAAILILLSLAKLIVVLRNPRAWIGFTKRLYAKPQVTSGVALAAAGVILLLLIRSGLDIVQILAVCLFVVCLIVVGVAPYARHLFDGLETQDIETLIQRQWLYLGAWIVLLVWGAYELVT